MNARQIRTNTIAIRCACRVVTREKAHIRDRLPQGAARACSGDISEGKMILNDAEEWRQAIWDELAISYGRNRYRRIHHNA